MATPVRHRMTVAEFMDWQSESDRRYELHDGLVKMMAPTLVEHQIVQTNLTILIGSALKQWPSCTVRPATGIRIPDREDIWYEPDLTVTCDPPRPRQRETAAPLLIIEILSASTELVDRKRKLPDYRLIPSVQEIVLIDPSRPYTELHRRLDADHWLTEIHRNTDAVLVLESINLSLALSDIYDKIAIDPSTMG